MPPAPPHAWRLTFTLAAALLALPASAQRGVHEDAAPQYPPGFEPIDVGTDVQAIERREEKEMRESTAVSREYQTASPEGRLRYRYGAATWNMYEPYQ